MPSEFFGLDLLENGLISREVLLEAVAAQKDTYKPLCALVVEAGLLTPGQMQALDDKHCDTGKKYLEVALRERIITFGQLEELYRKKPDRWICLGETLLRGDHVTLAQLKRAFDAYKDGRKGAQTDINVILEGMPHMDVVPHFVRITVDMFLHHTSQIVKAVSAKQEKPKFEGVARLYSQRVTGLRKFVFAAAIPDELAVLIASYIMGESKAEMDSIAVDAVCEFVNVVVGHGCSELCNRNCKVHAEPPVVLTTEQMAAMETSSDVAVTMMTTMGEFSLVFLFD